MIAFRLVVLLFPLLCSCGSAPLPPPDTPLLSVRIGSDFVVASYAGGIVRADLKEQVWEPVDLPPDMPLGGDVTGASDGSGPLYYYTNRSPRAADGSEQSRLRGIYRSLDKGLTWTLAGRLEILQTLFCHPNGTLYAIAGDHDGSTPYRTRPWRSKDCGSTWEKLSLDDGTVYGFFVDPDHPDRVACRSNAIRNYIHQTTDDPEEWKTYRETEWYGEHATPEWLFEHVSLMGTSNPGVGVGNPPLRIGDFFSYGFTSNDSTAFRIVRTEHPRYRFRRGEPMPVRITIKNHRDDRTLKLPEFEDNGCWSLTILTPDGTLETVPDARPPYNRETREEVRTAARNRPDFQVVELQPGETYAREFRVDEMYAFDHPGTYRLRFRYDSNWFGDPTAGEWAGYMAGNAFEVIVE